MTPSKQPARERPLRRKCSDRCRAGQAEHVYRHLPPTTTLRGIAARAPYFHSGAAADLNELVNFYNRRFQMNLTDEQKEELIAFLNSL